MHEQTWFYQNFYFNTLNDEESFNFIAVLSPEKDEAKDEDEPLLIIANYDSPYDTSYSKNPVEDNGSGLASLLVVAECISKEIEAGEYKLKHSLIFAATDASFRKYVSKPAHPATARGSILVYGRTWS